MKPTSEHVFEHDKSTRMLYGVTIRVRCHVNGISIETKQEQYIEITIALPVKVEQRQQLNQNQSVTTVVYSGRHYIATLQLETHSGLLATLSRSCVPIALIMQRYQASCI